MYGADCVHARMCYADLSCSNLRELNLYGAQMEGANLRESDLTGAKFGKNGCKESVINCVISVQMVNYACCSVLEYKEIHGKIKC